MLTIADVGNTHTRIALWDGEKLAVVRKLKTAVFSPESLAAPAAACCVVPELGSRLKAAGVFMVSAENCALRFNGVDASTLGADRLANAVVAAKGALPAVVVDCGTAITFEVVNAAGEFSGGAILAGRELLRRSLHYGTAQLPLAEGDMARFIGRNTAEAIASGVDGGAAGAVKEVLSGIIGELGGAARVVLTGGDAEFFRPRLPGAELVENLTLMGVLECCKNNMGKVICE